jgi:ComF family protein
MLLDIVVPRRCAVCAHPGTELCARCLAAIRRLGEPRCNRCGAPTAWPVPRCRECAGRRLAFVTAREAVAYDERVRVLVRSWKERGLRRLAAIAAALVDEVVGRPDVAALVFVPPDRDRSLRRGHHPAERLAAELGSRWELPVSQILARARPAERQAGLTLADRRRNVSGAFRATARPPPRVALVDDVYTSGATANAAASALRRAGARRVEVLTLARAVR